jgi:hypothetical protein
MGVADHVWKQSEFFEADSLIAVQLSGPAACDSARDSNGSSTSYGPLLAVSSHSEEGWEALAQRFWHLHHIWTSPTVTAIY